MKPFTSLIFITSLLTAGDGPFTLTKKDTISLFEAKIVAQIAIDISPKDVTLFVTGESREYTALDISGVKITKNCQEANFIFIAKENLENLSLCDNNKAIYFTDSKELFKNNKNVVGLFFWLKSRPNITFSSKRLETKSITLPKSYARFIEEI